MDLLNNINWLTSRSTHTHTHTERADGFYTEQGPLRRRGKGGVGVGAEEEQLDIRRGETSVRKNQCGSMPPLGVFSVSL